MARNRIKKNPQSQDMSSTIEIPEDEQLRLIKESGIMGKVASIPKPEPHEEDITPFAEEMFGAIVLIIPFCFLLLLMEMCGPVKRRSSKLSIDQRVARAD